LVDELDRKIVSFMSGGVYSYGELAKLCGVGRSTIYRRVEELERKGVIRRKVMAVPDFEKLGLSAVIIGMDMYPNELERVVPFLKEHDRVKLLWKTYGTHDIVLAILCDRDDIGSCIHDLRKELAELGVTPAKFDVSISISWEKMQLRA